VSRPHPTGADGAVLVAWGAEPCVRREMVGRSASQGSPPSCLRAVSKWKRDGRGNPDDARLAETRERAERAERQRQRERQRDTERQTLRERVSGVPGKGVSSFCVQWRSGGDAGRRRVGRHRPPVGSGSVSGRGPCVRALSSLLVMLVVVWRGTLCTLRARVWTRWLHRPHMRHGDGSQPRTELIPQGQEATAQCHCPQTTELRGAEVPERAQPQSCGPKVEMRWF